jgi:cytochrome b561
MIDKGRSDRSTAIASTGACGRRRHDGPSIALHWLIAALVAVLAPLGITLRSLPFPSAAYDTYHMWHRSIGEVTLVVVMLYLWRMARRARIEPLDDVEWRRTLSRWVQGLMLALLIVVPLSKLARGAFGIGWAFFGFKVATPWPQHATASGILTVIHDYGALTLLALAGLHVLAALWHAIVLRDASFRSILPARQQSQKDFDDDFE